ncbi:DUF4369 domain-containing protein [uncultured Planktosalinus sp.]|uniref:DUF4369 domain-containing protein n=1 Tax=uncultured Planktosalinus sp. TaxID=1810935 RepID=UPI0030D7DB1B
MKKFLSAILTIVILISCSNEPKNTHITGSVNGLKKGTLYLEKLQDSSFITLDSVVLKGTSEFNFSIQLESPEVVYMLLRKTEGTQIEDGIEIFAEPGTIEVYTSLENFENEAKVTGSLNHKKLVEYNKLMQRYSDRSLELFADNIQAENNADELRKVEINKEYESLIKSKYMATINFALNHKDLEVAPYLTLTEIFDANIKYLDTIYHSLNEKVKVSTYGKQLETFIKERKQLKEIE